MHGKGIRNNCFTVLICFYAPRGKHGSINTFVGFICRIISLDTDTATFEQALKSYPFFAYCDYKKWDSTPVKDYYVFGTLTFYLLNQQREIILRPNSVNQMAAWVDWNLVPKPKD